MFHLPAVFIKHDLFTHMIEGSQYRPGLWSATWASLPWSLPCPQHLSSGFSLLVKNPIEASVLLAEASLARKQRKTHTTFIPLMLNEMPQVGDLVGLDAEFVTLNEVTKSRNEGCWDRTLGILGVISISLLPVLTFLT